MDTSQLYSAMEEPNQGSTSSSGGRGKRRSREIETLSLEIRKCPRDLFHSFLTTDPIATQNGHNRPPNSAIEEQREDGEIELNLGLSLGGRFGVDKSHKGLIRASSIAGTVPTFREVEESAAAAAAAEAAPARAEALARTSSLPAETEEEWRRRKEMQSLRRMEARRRRSEKQRNMKESSIGGGGGEERESGPGLNLKGKLERQQSGQPGKLNPGPGFEAPVGVKGKGGFFGSLQGLLAQQQQQQGYSQGSGESQGGCSSGVSELESKTHHQGSNDYGSQDPTLVSSSCTKYGEPETSDDKKKGAEAAGAGGIEDMPCVFTVGDGPSGRKVQGILYRYSRGEEVRIMCVCHGSFFSPSEFVKHAGGRDVDHPLKHIVVNPSPSPF